jgi:hypothetical protein
MASRKFAYVNEKQNRERINRAALRYRTLRDNGADDVQVERASAKLNRLQDASDIMRGWHLTGPVTRN